MAKVIIVTGGGRGIGAATCLAAARAGYAVCVNYGHSAADADAVAETIRSGGSTAITVAADVGREDDIIRMFETVDRQLGPVAALVNNAGIARLGGEIAELESEKLMDVFATNVFGTILCSREAIRRMSTVRGGAGGAIVNVSSIAARTGGRPGETIIYGASKGAIDNFTVGVAREVGGQGIRVNAVRPGPVRRDRQTEAQVEAASRRMPRGEIGRPDEVAEMILFLLSDEASLVNGALIDITGGL